LVHVLPDENGVVKTHINTSRSGYYVANFDIDNNVTMSPAGGGSFDITVPPGTKVHISDKIGMTATGANSQRNYVFLMWSAGEAS